MLPLLVGGTFYKGESAHGFWNSEEQKLHITSLQLLAAFWALETFASQSHNCEILLRIDNTTAIAYVNKIGGIQYPHLNCLSRKFWGWCESREILIYASYIASKDNIEADRESRIENVDTEWELADYAFQRILENFPSPEIDLFATNLNSKCKLFCSWENDPNAVRIDTFTISWVNIIFYAFPPFAMILRTLRKIATDAVYGIIIVSLWTSQPWFPIFQSMLICEPLIFSPK